MISSSTLLRRTVVASRFFSAKTGPVTVGIIGLGNMGIGMATNLAKAPATLQSKVLVFDMDKSKSQSLAQFGAVEAADIKTLAQQSDVIITMLPASKHVVGVMHGPDGIFANAKAGALIIDSSTIDPLTSRSLSEEAATKGLRMIDAPVSGGVGGAAAGTLTFMVGGSAENLEAARVSVFCISFKQQGFFLMMVIFFVFDIGCAVCDGQEHRALR